METRRITVVPTRAQRTYVVETGAETLAELKAALDEAGIDYENMSFLEGLTKTELVNDESLLPKNVEYKGRTTNELVIMLTNTEKKITSGIDRKELYAKIKQAGLGEVVKKAFGKNYTQVSSSDLVGFLNNEAPSNTDSASTEKPVEEAAPCHLEERVSALEQTVDKLLKTLYSSALLDDDELGSIKVKITEDSDFTDKKDDNSVYSEDELNDILNF